MTVQGRADGGRRPRRLRVAISFRLKLALVMLGVSAVVAAVAVGTLNWVMRESSRTLVSVAMGLTAVQTAMRVNEPDVAAAAGGDKEARTRLEQLLARGRERVRMEVRPTLTDPIDLEAVLTSAYIATVDRTTGEAVVVASVGDVPVGARFPLPIGPTGSDALGGLVNETELSDKPQGRVLSSFAPIREADGTPIGLVGMDVSGRFFAVPYRASAVFGVTIFSVALLIGVPWAWALSARLNGPVKSLAEGLERVAEGDLDVRLPTHATGDEFDLLAARFNAMASGLKEREEMHRSLESASEVQRHLLPLTPPVITGYDVSAAVRYCDQTGGDYVDCFPLDDGPDSGRADLWGLAVGDVTGHGVAAALLMTWTRAMLRAAAPIHATDPSGLMRTANRHLLRDTESGTFLTLFFASLDPVRHAVAWASAGHEPGVLVRAMGEVERLDATGVPLGIDAEEAAPSGRPLRLGPGDILVVGTDGVTQARSPDGEFFGPDRLAAAVRQAARAGGRGVDLRMILDAVFEAVDAHRGGQAAADDAALLIIRRNHQ